MPDVEVDFPRGGSLAPVLSTTQKPLKKRRQTAAASERSEEHETKKRRVDPEYEDVFTKQVTKQLLTEDVRGLGIVKKIRETDIILETSNGIKTLVDARSISAEFTKNLGQTSLDEIFEIGQALAFKVVKRAKKKDEEPKVTIDPAAVNCHLVPASFKNALVINGSVKSIEDKGAVINIGMSKVTGFVKDEDLPPAWKLDKLHIGQVLMFRVRKSTNAASQRVIELSAFPEMDTYSDEKLSLSDIMPGTVLSVEPDKVVHSGVFGNLDNGIKIFISKHLLPARLRLDPGRFVKPIRALVVCTLPNSPIFVVSAHPDIVGLSKLERRQLPEEHRPGQQLKCTVYDVDKFGNVHFILDKGDEKTPQLTAITTKNMFEDFDKDVSKFTIGSSHECRVMNYRMLDRMLVVSTRKDVLKQKIVQISDLVPGQRLNAVVHLIKDNGLTVKLGAKGEDGAHLLGFISAQHVLDRVRKNWKKNFQVGQRISCRVLSLNDDKTRAFLTAKPLLVSSNLSIVTEIDRSLVGETVVGVAFNPFDSGAFLVQFYNNVAGYLSPDDAKTLKDLSEGDVVKARVAKVDLEKRRILLTLREDVGLIEKKKRDEMDESKKMVPVKRPAKPFQVCQARVLGPWRHGKTSPFTTAELRLQGGTIGRLHVSELDLNDAPDESSPMTEFLDKNLNSMIEVKVICVGNRNSINEAGKKVLLKKCGTSRFVECTAVKSKIAEPFRKLHLINYQLDFRRGDKVKAFIGEALKSTNDEINFVKAEINPLVFARIPKSYIKLTRKADHEQSALEKDAAFAFADGELRRGIVISQERSARSKYVNVALGDTIIKEEVDEDKMLQGVREAKRKRRDSNASDSSEVKVFETGVQDPGFDFSLGMFSMANMAKVGKKNDQDDESEEESEIKEEPEEDDEQTLLRRERRTAEREARLREAIPENSADFDRLLTATPSSSDLWIKYITYFLREENVEEARKMAERALTSINFREDAELFNIWTAYLNLEVLFGDAASLKAVFGRAVNAADSLKMHKQMAKILAHHKRYEELDELFESMIKKFRHEDLEVWFNYAAYLYETDRLNEARKLLERALTSLNKKHHLTVLPRFAQMEYRFGDQERGKTMFEKLLQTHPKKTDVWNVYMDMSLKYEGIVEARKLLQRAIASDMGSYRTRIFYEKWLKAEEQFGDDESVEMVREHAKEFLDKRKQEDEEDEKDDY